MSTMFTVIKVMFRPCSKDERLRRPRNEVTRESQVYLLLVCLKEEAVPLEIRRQGKDRHFECQSAGRRAGWEEGPETYG